MGELLAFPFRLAPNGSIVKTDDRTDQGISQLIGSIVLTHLGELEMFPTFGVSDPLFSQLEPAQVAAAMAAYGPQVRLTKLDARFTGPAQQTVAIEWTADQTDADRANA